MVKKPLYKVPNLRNLGERFFSANDIIFSLRDLNYGIDNRELRRLWSEGLVHPPLVAEPTNFYWTYEGALQLIKDLFELRGIDDTPEREMIALLCQRKAAHQFAMANANLIKRKIWPIDL